MGRSRSDAGRGEGFAACPWLLCPAPPGPCWEPRGARGTPAPQLLSCPKRRRRTWGGFPCSGEPQNCAGAAPGTGFCPAAPWGACFALCGVCWDGAGWCWGDLLGGPASHCHPAHGASTPCSTPGGMAIPCPPLCPLPSPRDSPHHCPCRGVTPGPRGHGAGTLRSLHPGDRGQAPSARAQEAVPCSHPAGLRARASSDKDLRNLCVNPAAAAEPLPPGSRSAPSSTPAAAHHVQGVCSLCQPELCSSLCCCTELSAWHPNFLVS